MDIDYFDKEDRIDKFLLLSPVFAGVAIFAGCAYIQAHYVSNPYATKGGLIMFIAGIILSIFFFIKYSFMPKITVNIRELSFWIGNQKLYFSDLMPTYDIEISTNTKFTFWYKFTLYLKDGNVITFNQPFIRGAHLSKYLSKYAKPSNHLKMSGIKFR